MALVYHGGQVEAQEEANTRPIAERLTRWMGPVAQFAAAADALLLAAQDGAGVMRFAALAGAPPLMEEIAEGTLLLSAAPAGWQPLEGGRLSALCGALAVNLGQRRRARLNGTLARTAEGWTLAATERFINCRKYIAPSLALAGSPRSGPAARAPLAPDDPWLAAVLAGAETAFLASISPAGLPDLSHRGGPAGFLSWHEGVLTWPEYVGDGMFKSAGNVRATGAATLLAVDLASGDAAELWGRATYATVRREGAPREAGLLQDRDPFPVQGQMRLEVAGAARLTGMLHPRQRTATTERITSCSPIPEQAPA